MGNCKQIIIALRIYADEHGGAYPDVHDSVPMTSNQAFRLLFREGVLDDERIFGCKASQFIPDMSIGGPPEYPEALEAGENHWAMTKGVTEKSRADMPLIFENPVLAGWPPAWNAGAVGKLVKGRVWPGGKITVGFNDSSIQMIKLESAKSTNVTPAHDADGKDVFTRAAKSMEILDIER